MPNPALIVTDTHEEYLDLYEEDGIQDPWYTKLFNVHSRAYWTARRGDQDGCIVVDGSRFGTRLDTVYAFLNDALGTRLGLEGLIIHEWGHAAGHSHTHNFLDVMDAPSLRILDRYNLVERSKTWRQEHVTDILDDIQ